MPDGSIIVCVHLLPTERKAFSLIYNYSQYKYRNKSYYNHVCTHTHTRTPLVTNHLENYSGIFQKEVKIDCKPRIIRFIVIIKK